MWSCITLTYAAGPAGVAKAIHTLTPGADPADIRLRYNLKTSLDADGSLKFTLPNGQCWLSESAPLFWLGGPVITWFKVNSLVNSQWNKERMALEKEIPSFLMNLFSSI